MSVCLSSLFARASYPLTNQTLVNYRHDAGWCDDTWKDGMSREEAEAWVTRAISLAITMDSSSGGVIRLVTIDDKGCNKQMLEPYKHPMTYGELPVKRVGVDAMAA